MRTLLIDTASPACSVALFEGDLPLGAHHEIIGRGHAERLVSLISTLPAQGKADRILVDVGPGSFTGIRVGLSAAKALAFAWNCPCIGYSQMALLAAIALKDNPDARGVDVVINGGHGEVFVQSFDASLGSVSELVSVVPDAARGLLKFDLITGDAAGEALADSLPDTQFVAGESDMRRWHENLALPSLPPSALYVRAADAKLPAKVKR